jgi:hypothetical protein
MLREESDMNFEAWNVDLDTASAVHECGLRITVEGDPANPNGVNPGKFPEHLSAVEQARLLRCGLEAIQKAALSARSARSAEPKSVVKHTPTRPLLSLKKSI